MNSMNHQSRETDEKEGSKILAQLSTTYQRFLNSQSKHKFIVKG